MFCSSNVIFSKSVAANVEKLKLHIFNVNIYFLKSIVIQWRRKIKSGNTIPTVIEL